MPTGYGKTRIMQMLALAIGSNIAVGFLYLHKSQMEQDKVKYRLVHAFLGFRDIPYYHLDDLEEIEDKETLLFIDEADYFIMKETRAIKKLKCRFVGFTATANQNALED